MTQKEELRKKFDEFIDKNNDIIAVIDSYDSKLIFDFFWKEIEAREKRIKQWEDAINIMGVHTKTVDMAETILNQNVKISHLQATLEAADDVIKIFERPYEYNELQVRTILEKYNQLKTKSQS